MDSKKPAKKVLAFYFTVVGLAFVGFWVQRFGLIEHQDYGPDLGICQDHQKIIRKAFETYGAKRKESMRDMLRRAGRGATLGPLFQELTSAGLVSTPPPHTKTCRSWIDYTVVDAQFPTFDKISCRIHGGHHNLVRPSGPSPQLPQGSLEEGNS